ncbi:acyl-CoA carboxylase subunit beta [Variovorax sp. M-6]|uniref:acyl-CoA carboxylase subunit beta n=1 Tax=Variovorax sp. M-6 TaxID=3233041 RepID=UPI003F9E1E44
MAAILDQPAASRAPGPAPGRTAWAEAQHARGRLTAGERVELLLDEGSSTELGARLGGDDACSGDGVVTVRGTIGGRAVCVFAKDMSVSHGTLAEVHARKICRLQELALESRVPIIGIFDTAGLRLESGMAAMAGHGAIVRNAAAASGVVPQISLIVGGCPGADALLPPLSDFVFMANGDSSLFLSAPEVVQRVTGEEVSAEQLGGAGVHSKTSSLADGAFDNEVLAIRQLRRLFGFLPLHNRGGPTQRRSLDDAGREAPALDTLVPPADADAYDVKELIAQVSDDADFFELQSAFAPNAVIGFARVDGRTVGVVANQSSVLAGVLDGDAARKMARFVRFCDAFGIAVLTFVDTPGFLPGVAQEHGGVARHVGKLLCAYAQATVPLVTVVLRKAFGGAGGAMGARALGADLVYAWPDAQIGLLNAQGAVALGDDPQAARQRLTADAAWHRGDIDDVIVARQTRRHLVRALELLAHKSRVQPWRKHANLPL